MRTASSTISKTAKAWRGRAAVVVVEQEEVELWLEVRLITSRQHVLRRWKRKVTQPRLSKVKAVKEEAKKHLMAMRSPHVVVAVEPRARSQTLVVDKMLKRPS